MCLDSPLLKSVEVVRRWINRIRQRVQEVTSKRDESVQISVNSCISKVDSKKKVRVSKQFCGVKLYEMR